MSAAKAKCAIDRIATVMYSSTYGGSKNNIILNNTIKKNNRPTSKHAGIKWIANLRVGMSVCYTTV